MSASGVNVMKMHLNAILLEHKDSVSYFGTTACLRCRRKLDKWSPRRASRT